MKFFLSCARGLEPLAADELLAMQLEAVRPTAAGASFEGDVADARRVLLWSRVGSRLLLPLFECDANPDALANTAQAFDWSIHLQPGAPLAIDFSGTNKDFRHSHFGALRLKDGVADWHRATAREMPQWTPEAPLRLSARIDRGKVQVALDLTGEGLHRRGYRQRQGIAPLRETLAAALLMRAGWPDIAAKGGALLDPMSGSGTLVIEAAMMAVDMAPGLKRDHWGIDHWVGAGQSDWRALIEEAEQRLKQGLGRWQDQGASPLLGSDIDARVIHSARDNLSRCGLQQLASFTCADIKDLSAAPAQSGLVICNPPYGERLGDQDKARRQYQLLGDRLHQNFQGWRAAILAPDESFGRATQLHSFKNYQVRNGALDCRLYLFDLKSDSRRAENREREPSEGAKMVAARLTKNRARLKSWLNKSGVQAWRVYDADIPEYAAAVDLYQTSEGLQVVVQEYAAPKTIDAGKARHRFNELCSGVKLGLDVTDAQLHIKQRQRQKGKSQYQASDQSSGREWQVREGAVKLLVNLDDYLDTGLFLDHRPVRQLIAAQARNKSFLNLFCYTAVASLHAAVGGASASLSLDMSNTYLDWARRNFQLNELNHYQHKLQRQDCLDWLKQDPQGQWDLILLDPPTFSNSAKMEGTLDIQRDHQQLVESCMQRLAPGGLLIFSNNLRRFKLDQAVGQRWSVEDWSAPSIDPDFERNARIHQCFLIRHG